MRRIALHTRLKPGREDEYDDVHATVPVELATAIRAAGVHGWWIWRDGLDLFHLVEVEDYQRMRHELRDHPANIGWQARMATLLDVADDYSGTDTGLPLVWALPAAPGGATA
ncbi:L-rhamnose mutarotase [Micromonospora sp. WP24]|uniref:L-rhamnose mutarotase n=1 Tax=Micromonospora sp. WP24 TaxID=2604469 RepID=UPI0011D6A293|nr:L-rhamnose mutarotase [Micromonospora sp. WP24]TYC06632.1 L-rhamnose mutarotase [Micromonospora sp. WP24]